MPERSPFTSAMNTGTPMRENSSASTCRVTVLPVPVAPATSPWRLASPGRSPSTSVPALASGSGSIIASSLGSGASAAGAPGGSGRRPADTEGARTTGLASPGGGTRAQGATDESSTTRRSGRPPSRSARRRTSWPAASAPGRPRPGRQTGVRPRPGRAPRPTGQKPWKLGRPVHCPSDAITVASPMVKLACITLFSAPGGTMPASQVSGLSLNRSSAVDLGVEGAPGRTRAPPRSDRRRTGRAGRPRGRRRPAWSWRSLAPACAPGQPLPRARSRPARTPAAARPRPPGPGRAGRGCVGPTRSASSLDLTWISQ